MSSTRRSISLEGSEGIVESRDVTVAPFKIIRESYARRGWHKFNKSRFLWDSWYWQPVKMLALPLFSVYETIREFYFLPPVKKYDDVSDGFSINHYCDKEQPSRKSFMPIIWFHLCRDAFTCEDDVNRIETCRIQANFSETNYKIIVLKLQ